MTIRYEEGYAHIESHEFYKFIEEIQELSLFGYTLDISNARFPAQYVGYWSAYFNAPAGEGNLTEQSVKQVEQSVTQAEKEEEVESATADEAKETPRRGRLPRNR